MYSHSPVLEAVYNAALSHSEKVALVINDSQVTYGELLNGSRQAATILKNMGLRPAERIVLCARKEIEFIYLYLGAHILGVTNVIVDAECNEERLRYIEQKTKPKCCFGYQSSQFPSRLFAELDFTDEAYQEDGATCSELVELCSVSTDSIAEILFTTGTTGAPKGVCLSYANIAGSADNINRFIGNSQDDVEIIGLPICHSFGLGRIRCNLLKGATVVLLGSFANVRAFFNAIEKYHATGFGVVPAAWAYIRRISGTRIAKYASQIKYIEIGSAPMPLETKKEMLQMFPTTRICMHYGLTEASRVCFVEFHDREHLESIGRPVCDKVDVRIINGEICVRGNMVMKCYLEDGAYHEDGACSVSTGGSWFRTGDCGYMAEDGYIYLLGREKELINVGGKKVSPMEVEDAICSLGVGDCVCVPMTDPDGIMGERVKCYLLRGSTDLTFEQIAERLARKLEFYKLPAQYEWIDEIPRTASGKKQRVNI